MDKEKIFRDLSCQTMKLEIIKSALLDNSSEHLAVEIATILSDLYDIGYKILGRSRFDLITEQKIAED